MAVGKINFTADTWSDQSRRPYVCVTAHWIARDRTTDSLMLKACVIAFHRLYGDHSGEVMAETLIHLLDRASITVNVGSILLFTLATITTASYLGGPLDA